MELATRSAAVRPFAGRVDSESNRSALAASYVRRDEVSGGLPVYLVLESTSICNLECVMCPYGKMTRSKHHMPMALYEKIIGEAAGFVEFAWLHMFSEPLLNKRIYEMIDLAEEAGIRTGLSTNATPLSDAAAQRLLASKLSVLLVSIDGATKEVYESLRVGANFEKVERNVHRFAEAKLASSNDTLKAVLSIIDMRANRSEIDGFVEYWRGKGFDNVKVKPFHTWANQDADIISIGPGDAYDPILRPGEACHEPWVGFAVQADGKVVPCCNDYDGRQVLGDLTTQSIREVWNGSKMRELRRMFARGDDRQGTICEKCPFPCSSEESVEGGRGAFNPVQHQIGAYTR